MEQIKETIKESLKPVTTAGEIAREIGKQEVLEKLAPLSPGEAPTLKRRILEKIFGHSSK